MYFNGPSSRNFSFINYLAVKAAYYRHQPSRIFFYYNFEPKNNPNWDRMKQYVTMVQVDPPKEYNGVILNYPQYQADIVRLQKLYEHGGIYLDTDMLLIKSLKPFMDRHCVLGGESYIDHVENLNTNNPHKLESVSNACIICEDRSSFIMDWLRNIPEDMKKGIWAHHAVNLPLEMYKLKRDYFDLQPVETFVPFDFRNKYIFENDKNNLIKLENSYSMHMWQTIWQPELEQINDNYLKTVDNLFTYHFRDLAE